MGIWLTGELVSSALSVVFLLFNGTYILAIAALPTRVMILWAHKTNVFTALPQCISSAGGWQGDLEDSFPLSLRMQERGTVDVVNRVAKTGQIQKTQVGQESLLTWTGDTFATRVVSLTVIHVSCVWWVCGSFLQLRSDLCTSVASVMASSVFPRANAPTTFTFICNLNFHWRSRFHFRGLESVAEPHTNTEALLNSSDRHNKPIWPHLSQ